jgi:quinol monooxygenase YgiN
MTKVAIFAELHAAPGKQEELAALLASSRAFALDEPLTVVWFAVRFDTQTFAIFDAFDGDEGRQAHLNGAIAAALMGRADELLSGPPEIRFADVIADKLAA